MGHASGEGRVAKIERPLHRTISLLMVTSTFLPDVGGTELSTLREAQALRQGGHDARVLALRTNTWWPECEVLDGVLIRRSGGLFVRGRLRLRFGASLLAEALIFSELIRARHTYDVVQLRQLGRLARPAVLAGFITHKPLIVRVALGSGTARRGAVRTLRASDRGRHALATSSRHVPGAADEFGDFDVIRRTQWLSSLTLRLLRAPHVTFLALSTRIRSQLIDQGYRPEQIVTIPNGIDAADYRTAANVIEERHVHGAQETMSIVCPARFSYQKGQDILLYAWRIVQDRLPAVRLVLAGDGPLRPQFEALADSLGVAHCVEFADKVRDIAALLARSDGFVLPSRYEGMPNVLLEAMATSLPCVATRVSGSEDIIVDGACGWLVPPEDPYALADALLAMLSDCRRARAMGRAGRERINRAFDRGRQIEQLVELCAALASRSSPPAQARNCQQHVRVAHRLRQ